MPHNLAYKPRVIRRLTKLNFDRKLNSKIVDLFKNIITTKEIYYLISVFGHYLAIIWYVEPMTHVIKKIGAFFFDFINRLMMGAIR